MRTGWRRSAPGGTNRRACGEARTARRMFKVGGLVEFWSGDRGGCWKPGVVESVKYSRIARTWNVRITVGCGVCVVRPGRRCREMVLPIDLVPGTNPPQFRWRQVVDTIAGKRVVNHEGVLPPSVERAVETLVGVTKQLLMENAGLQGQVKLLEDRCANQAAIIEKAKGIAEPQTAQAGTKRGRG